jgi:magnesium chelatase subunit H
VELSAHERDRRVLELYERLLEIEERLIPTGLHVLGRPPDQREAGDMLRMVASFDRPELQMRSLPDLVAAGLGLPSYPDVLKQSAQSEESLKQRERIDSVVSASIQLFLSPEGGPEAATEFLQRTASVAAQETSKIFALLGRIRDQLLVNSELDSVVRALRAEYITPGPGADIVQNPDILPTGRNTHAVNPYGVPSPAAFQRGEAVARGLLERFRAQHSCYPEAVGVVLWGMDNIKTQGESVAHVLWLLGVRPRRDALNRVSDVEVLPLDQLGRPRIDVVLTVSGIFRDLFGTTMELLDRAIRRVAELDEPEEMNFVRKHVHLEVARGTSIDDAAIRVFSNAAGNYGTNVNFMVGDRQWERPDEIGNLFLHRKCFAYGRGVGGRQARELMERALERVTLTYQTLDSIEIGITDVDHYFEYLGGLSRAVENRSGKRPEIYMSDSLSPVTKMRRLQEVLDLETRTKTLNPKWYEGMLKHGYGGAAEIEHHVTNTFGWSATADAVDDWVYDAIATTYALDKPMLERLSAVNPHAAHGLVSRLLEAEGRGFWEADSEVIDRLREIASGLEDRIEGVR